ncbi:MAG: AP2 domain-containing protein [Pseudomonadota bacterium]
MGGIRLDLKDKKFGKLLVIKCVGVAKHYESMWECMCDCGNIAIVRGAHLKSGKTSSCGCLKNHHGMTINGKSSIEYRIWLHMKQRCYNKNDKAYKYYGARGIRICERWLNNAALFLKDMGKRPHNKLTIERINNDGDYMPTNCKWATWSEQNSNKRSR